MVDLRCGAMEVRPLRLTALRHLGGAETFLSPDQVERGECRLAIGNAIYTLWASARHLAGFSG